MRKIVNILTLLSLLLTISCTEDNLRNPGSVPVGEEVELRFGTFATRANAETEEEAVNRVRILIFGTVTSQDKGQLLCNKLAFPDTDGNIAPVIVTTGVRNIYLIINEPQNTDGSDLDAYKTITTEEEIEALELAYVGTNAASPYRPSDIPMFVKHIDRKVFPNSMNETNSDVERVMSKVTLNLNIKNSNFDDGKQPVIKNITIKNLPPKSYYIARPYTGNLVDSETQTPTAVTPVTGYDYSCTNTFYVPEYILSNLDKNAYLEIKGTINSDATSKVLTWFVKLGDAMVLDNPTANDRYDITRNRHYIMTGDVKTYGQFEELDVEVTVLPWNNVNGGSEMGDVLKFSKITTADGNAVQFADGGGYHVDAQGEKISVYCKTSLGGWYARTYKDGTLIHTSEKAGVSSSEEQHVEVVIPEIIDKCVEYTVKLYHSRFAPENVAAFKTLILKQGQGVIFNSVLVKPFTAANISYNGWTVNKPPHGLQLAKLGNVLPSKAALSMDPVTQWSTETNVDNGVGNVECGFGKSNTAALLKFDASKYPAVNLCKKLGEEWYLPSRNELVLIALYQRSLSSSYSSTEYSYWSASQEGIVNARWVGLFVVSDPTQNGSVGISPKTNRGFIRCVKNI